MDNSPHTPKTIDEDYDPYLYWIGWGTKLLTSFLVLRWLINLNLYSDLKAAYIFIITIFVLLPLIASFYFCFESKRRRYITLYLWAILGLIAATILLCIMIIASKLLFNIPTINNSIGL